MLIVILAMCHSLVSYGQGDSVAAEIVIDAPTAKVWDVMTNPAYARILGAEFDKGAFVESEWKLGSDVHFKYEPDKLISTGTITKLVEEELIRVDYDFGGFKYMEQYTLSKGEPGSVLGVLAGPYVSDFEAHVKVWNNWLAKVKEMSEAR